MPRAISSSSSRRMGARSVELASPIGSTMPTSSTPLRPDSNHARVLSGLNGVELVGIVDPIGEANSTLRAPILRELDELIALGIDYAVVACPTALHEEVGVTLATN